MSKRKTSRPEIFYDQFRSYTESGEWLTPLVAPGDTHLMYASVIQSALRTLENSQVRVLTADVVCFALELASKAGKTPVPYIPYPRYPMWIEFGDGIVVGGGNTHFKAVWVFPAMDRPNTIHFDLITLDGQAKGLFVREDDGSWSWQQGGACTPTYASCPRARKTIEGEPYEISSGEAPALALEQCTCAEAGREWSQIVFLIGHILRMPGHDIKETVVNRNLPLPRGFHDLQHIEAENKKYPRYITLSLSRPLQVHQTTTKHVGKSTATSGDYVEMQKVAGAWRALIPGEGKPWKELQILYVGPYERRGKVGENPTRYIIEP